MCAKEILRAKNRLTCRGGQKAVGNQGESWTSEVQRNTGQQKRRWKENQMAHEKIYNFLLYLVIYLNYKKPYQNKNHHPCVNWRNKRLPRNQVFLLIGSGALLKCNDRTASNQVIIFFKELHVALLNLQDTYL